MLARLLRWLSGQTHALLSPDDLHDCWTAEEFDTAQARDHGRA